jgi:hypothetical protein
MTEHNEELLVAFFNNAQDAAEHWAEVRIEEIEHPNPKKDLTPAEIKILQNLIETKVGREALEKLLVDCGRSNFFSVLTSIDGYTFNKSLELINTQTLQPLKDHPISPYFTLYCRELERLNE